MTRWNPEPVIDRLRARTIVDAAESGCHLWTGHIDADGYGIISAGPREGEARRKLYTHRVAYEAAHGEISDGLVVDHLCRNRSCCNPAHLEAVTQQQNMQRGSFGGRTHCKHGHEYTPENTYRDTRGRQCRECRRLRVKARRAPLPVRPDSAEPSGWRDISSAPKDGTEIEVLYADGTEDEVQWEEDRYCMIGPPQGAYGPGWQDTTNRLPVMDDFVVTHWRPKSPNPEDASLSGRQGSEANTSAGNAPWDEKPDLLALKEAVAMISRMKLFPDDKINRTTLQSAIHIACQALEQSNG